MPASAGPRRAGPGRAGPVLVDRCTLPPAQGRPRTSDSDHRTRDRCPMHDHAASGALTCIRRRSPGRPAPDRSHTDFRPRHTGPDLCAARGRCATDGAYPPVTVHELRPMHRARPVCTPGARAPRTTVTAGRRPPPPQPLAHEPTPPHTGPTCVRGPGGVCGRLWEVPATGSGRHGRAGDRRPVHDPARAGAPPHIRQRSPDPRSPPDARSRRQRGAHVHPTTITRPPDAPDPPTARTHAHAPAHKPGPVCGDRAMCASLRPTSTSRPGGSPGRGARTASPRRGRRP